MLESLVESRLALQLAFVLLAGELAFVLWRGRRRGRRFMWAGAANILAGGFLLVAVYAALTGGMTRVVALGVLFGGLAHLADSLLRWRR